MAKLVVKQRAKAHGPLVSIGKLRFKRDCSPPCAQLWNLCNTNLFFNMFFTRKNTLETYSYLMLHLSFQNANWFRFWRW